MVHRTGYGTDPSLPATAMAGLHTERHGRVGESGEGNTARWRRGETLQFADSAILLCGIAIVLCVAIKLSGSRTTTRASQRSG